MAMNTARDLQKEAAWRRRVDRHANSGQSVRAWCRDHRVTETAFYWWRRERARRDAEQTEVGAAGAGHGAVKAKPASFVPIHVAAEGLERGDSRIEIVLTDGRRVCITGVVDQQMLTDVLDVLGRRAC